MTQEELRDHLARQLGLIGASDALDSEDANLLTTIMENCHGELEQLNVALWTLDDVPDFAREAFVKYCIPSCEAWGQIHPGVGSIPYKKAALDSLRYLTHDPRNGVGKAQYF